MRLLLEELTAVGRQLLKEIRRLAGKYHIKSDAHEILSYEAEIMDCLLECLAEGQVVRNAGQESVILSSWGRSLSREEPQIVEAAERFYRSIEEAS